MNILLLLSVLTVDVAWYSPEEMDPRAILASANNGPLVLLSRVINPKLVLFDFRKRQAIDIKDGRLRMMMGLPLPFEDGFAIISYRLGVIYFIDENGEFLRQSFLRDVRGWDAALRIVKLTPESAGRASVTLQHNQDDTLIVARLDLKQNSLELLHNRAREPIVNEYWIGTEQGHYFVCEDTGQISLLDSDGNVVRDVRPKRELLRRHSKRGRSPYHARIEWFSYVDDVHYFSLRRFDEDAGKDATLIGRQVVAVSKGEAEVISKLPHGHWQGEWLLLDQDNGVFSIEKELAK